MPRWKKSGVSALLLLVVASTSSSLVHVDANEPAETLRERQACLARLGIERWHAKGFCGKEVTVAILDCGFRGYRDFLGKELPAVVASRSFRKDRNLEARDSQHGILCAEVIHAIAPEANLLLANWEPDSPAAFLDAVRWAKGQGARVLSCSLIMPTWSDGEGGGCTHAALAKILGDGKSAGDLLFFASAGNTAQRHWTGRFRPDEEGRHQWAPGITRTPLRPWSRAAVAVEVYGPSRLPLEIDIIERDTGAIIAKRESSGEANEPTALRFDPAPGRSYQVQVRGPNSTGQERFHLVALGGDLDAATPAGSIPFPGDGARVLAIAAVDRAGKREPYSSCGGTSPFAKPDFAAQVPFPSLCRGRPFGGTSAAAPQAAGLAAVWLSRSPLASPDHVLAALRKAALDLGPPGHDAETGDGLVRLGEW